MTEEEERKARQAALQARVPEMSSKGRRPSYDSEGDIKGFRSRPGAPMADPSRNLGASPYSAPSGSGRTQFDNAKSWGGSGGIFRNSPYADKMLAGTEFQAGASDPVAGNPAPLTGIWNRMANPVTVTGGARVAGLDGTSTIFSKYGVGTTSPTMAPKLTSQRLGSTEATALAGRLGDFQAPAMNFATGAGSASKSITQLGSPISLSTPPSTQQYTRLNDPIGFGISGSFNARQATPADPVVRRPVDRKKPRPFSFVPQTNALKWGGYG